MFLSGLAAIRRKKIGGVYEESSVPFSSMKKVAENAGREVVWCGWANCCGRKLV
jgi:hypothetical protein